MFQAFYKQIQANDEILWTIAGFCHDKRAFFSGGSPKLHRPKATVLSTVMFFDGFENVCVDIDHQRIFHHSWKLLNSKHTRVKKMTDTFGGRCVGVVK